MIFFTTKQPHVFFARAVLPQRFIMLFEMRIPFQYSNMPSVHGYRRSEPKFRNKCLSRTQLLVTQPLLHSPQSTSTVCYIRGTKHVQYPSCHFHVTFMSLSFRFHAVFVPFHAVFMPFSCRFHAVLKSLCVTLHARFRCVHNLIHHRANKQ
jgi:hypothetical protein